MRESFVTHICGYTWHMDSSDSPSSATAPPQPSVSLLARIMLALVSYAVYAFILGPWLAAGFMALFFVHEYGHLRMANRQQLQHDGICFYPLIGAVIILKEQPKHAADEAHIGLAGPLWGTVALLPVVIVALVTGSAAWTTLAFLAAILNLVNLLPVSPLDGGRIMAAIQPKTWMVGWIGLLALFIWRPSIVTAILVPLAGVESYQRLQASRVDDSGYYTVASRTSRWFAVAYILLAVSLAAVAYIAWPAASHTLHL